jgi:phosphoribosylformylglycinamidine cyclo-ligase
MPLRRRPLADAVMAPTRIYVKPLLALMQADHVKGMAHITGGGLTENIPRVLPDHLTAVIERSEWTLPPLFQWLQQEGQVADAEMHRVFNCGIGMVVIVARPGGLIKARDEGQAQTIVV